MAVIGKEVTVFNTNTGEIVNHTISYGSQNGDGWVIVYRDSYFNLLKNAPPSALKIFGFLMIKQPFEGGIKITKQAIAEELDLSRTVIWQGFKWLQENNYIKQRKVDGITEFLLNPNVTTCGKNRKEKLELWDSI